jgi:putative ABC transport system substrate-binding protein
LGAASLSSWSLWTAAFVQRLRELGWIDGRTIAIEYRWAEGRTERYTEIGTEFVKLKVDVIVTVGTAVPALKQLTATIPIVFAAALDPVGSGLVASLAQPGGNVTGLSMQSTELVSKRCEILREILPGLRRMAVMGNVDYSGARLEMREVEAVARTLGFEIDTAELRRAADISPAFEAFKSRVQALYVGDIPVEQPTKFDLGINLTTAKAIGLTLPESFLQRANELIE